MSRSFGLVFAFLAVGCSSSGGAPADVSDASADSGGVAVDCSAFADVYCRRFRECSAFFFELSFADESTCKQRLVETCKLQTKAAGDTVNAALTACTKNAASASCADVLTGNTCPSVPGSAADGAPCALDVQCHSTFCGGLDAKGCGHCAPAPADGTPCITSKCGPRSRCIKGICKTLKNLGEACSGDDCVVPLSCFGGKCSTPAPLDAACNRDGMGAPDCNIIEGGICFPTTCVKAGLAGTGEACGGTTSGVTFCRAGGSCNYGSMGTGTCRAPAMDGDPCDDSMGISCASPATCVAGVCRLPDPSACH
jgi:hypothetical protein